MPFLENLRKIDEYLDKIRALNNNMQRAGSMDRLQADLVREYLRDLYELYADLNKADVPVPGPPPVETVSRETPEAVVEEQGPEPGPEVKQTAPEPQTEEVQQPEPDASAVEAEASPESYVPQETVDRAAGENGPISLLEKFQKESGKDRKELNRKQVAGSGFKKLIPLNERIMMTREFFDNNVSAYESVLAELDGLHSRKEVLDYMQQNVWTSDLVENQRELIDRFIALIDLKFADGE